MSKKNERRICWSCDADVSTHLVICPYCNADVTHPPTNGKNEDFFQNQQNFASPFQRAPKDSPVTPSSFPSEYFPEPSLASNGSLVNEETRDVEESKGENDEKSNKKEIMLFFLLLPGIVFFLFGIILLLFSDGGVLTLTWSQNFAIFYFLGSLPMIFWGWKAIK